MAYQPQVVEAKIVSENDENGFYEVLAVLADRNRCRLTLESDEQSGKLKATHINRLHTVPCGICKKDYLCYCLDRYIEDIAEQVLELVDFAWAK